jgi:hypothetical protein
MLHFEANQQGCIMSNPRGVGASLFLTDRENRMDYEDIEELCMSLNAEANLSKGTAELISDILVRNMSDDVKNIMLEKLQNNL